jgi:tRNA1(Val) A37 N6-methylase TrmN6
VSYRQPIAGYRTGIEPVLLAASVPARSGQRVVEAGTGAGAGLLCLLARVAGLSAIGIERDADMAALARRNLADNAMGNACVETADITSWRADGPIDHAFANPPWHEAAGTPSPDRKREAAKRGQPGLLEDWAAALASSLRPRGTLSLILPARALAQGIAALDTARCPEITVLPLWPRQSEAAKLVILRGVRLGGGPCTMHPGLVLHGAGGAYTEAAQAILRHGKNLA